MEWPIWEFLEKLPILNNLKTFYTHGMAMNVNVILVNSFNMGTGLDGVILAVSIFMLFNRIID